jgi:hypothetical protein
VKAIAIVPGTAGSRLVERPEPSITKQMKSRSASYGWASAAPTGKRYPEAALRPRMVRPNSSSGTKCSARW